MNHSWIRRATVLCVSFMLLSVFATPAMARPREEQHYCESRNGVTIVQKGRAKCVTDGMSYAKAEGKKSIAYDGGYAAASRDSSYAKAGGTGSPGGTAIASGNDSYAIADTGGEAYASGDGSYASAHVGYATSNGTNSRAVAVDPGSFAKANGTDSKAVAVNSGEAGANSVSSLAQSAGAGGQALADGDYSSASARGHCYTCAGPNETHSCTAP